jgi:hypothetical protein
MFCHFVRIPAESRIRDATFENAVLPQPAPESADTKEWLDTVPVLKQWSEDLSQRAQRAHLAAQRLKKINRFLGGLNVALAAVTATAMYAALNKKLENLDVVWQLVITGIAVLPAIASGLQKEWQISARLQGNYKVRQDCLRLQKQLEFYLALPPHNGRETLASWHKQYAEVISRPVISSAR